MSHTNPPGRSAPSAWYALRRTLPPWRFEQTLNELIEQLPQYGVDEVIVKVDTEEFSHGHPTLDLLRDYLPRLQRIREAMGAIGVRYSVNPWVTLLHTDRGWDVRTAVPGAQTMVGHDGTQTRAAVCPLCPKWSAYIDQAWAIYAQSRPHVIWVEDDIRTFNHQPVAYGCFCPLHMDLFSRRIGERVTREQLVAAMLRPGEPHPWRRQYLDFQAQVMIDTVGHMAKAVHRVDPAIHLGLMSSGHFQHTIEGRRWGALTEALADGRPAYSRPTLGNYSETSMRGLYYDPDSIKGCRHVMPPGVTHQTEVENFTYGRYVNSARFTFLKIAVSFAYGADGVTMNLFDHAGAPMTDEPRFGRMLAQSKPMLNALASAAQRPGRYRGVQLLHHEQAGVCKHLPPGASYDDMLCPHVSGMEQLEAHGIATTYDAESVVSAFGQTLRAFSDEQVQAMLGAGRGLLLDAVAARVLVDRGYTPLIGLRKIAEPQAVWDIGPFAAESLVDPAFGGGEHNYMTLHTGGGSRGPRFSPLEPVAGVRIISRLVDAETTPSLIASYAFENALGGRVVVQAFDIDNAYNINYCRPQRRNMLQAVVQWLWRDQTPLLLRGEGAWPLAFRKDTDRGVLLGVFNLSLDDWDDATFDLSSDACCDASHSVRVLSSRGRWSSVKDVSVTHAADRLRIHCGRSIGHEQPLICLLPTRRA